MSMYGDSVDCHIWTLSMMSTYGDSLHSHGVYGVETTAGGGQEEDVERTAGRRSRYTEKWGGNRKLGDRMAEARGSAGEAGRTSSLLYIWHFGVGMEGPRVGPRIHSQPIGCWNHSLASPLAVGITRSQPIGSRYSVP